MKKLLIICILIVSVIFISGCTSDEQASSDISTSSQSNQESDAQNPELIIKPSDVPGLTLEEYVLYAVQKNTIYVYGNESDRTRYTNTLRIGYRNVGEESRWYDQSGRFVKIELSKYDSNSGLMELISNMKERYEEIKDPEGVKSDFGDPNIGDYSLYLSTIDLNTDIQGTFIFFIYKNNYVNVMVSDEKDESFNEAIRISKLVKSRLD
ncbi:MAG: hypothetical protein C5S45_09425 [Candidatus Methanocomedens sp.]|nr:MAG: hypothetical protein C5S45_09425 [ANME-2 cluster archaeon]